MKILHLLSNRKWTERAEPVADLVAAQRRLGLDARLACGRWDRPGDSGSSVEARAREKGLDPLVLELTKHFNVASAGRDVPRLRDVIRSERFDVLHAHMKNAHLLAALAARSLAPRPVIVRSSYEADGPHRGLRSRILLRRYTRGLIVLSELARHKARVRFHIPLDRIEAIEPGIDLDFFDPARPVSIGRPEFGLAPADFVIGMVTRIRADRRVDLAVKAVHLLRDTCPALRLLLAGHGEGEAEIEKLIHRLGVAERVARPGYCRGDHLAAAYRAMDALVYPVPGTDPSCRTVREALASGRPALASHAGFLPELIDDGETGLFFELNAEDLARRIEVLYRDRERLRRMEQSALATARRRFSPARQAERTRAFYQRLQVQST
jgi:glycosyltransferase involved in cell wall biosynthesis